MTDSIATIINWFGPFCGDTYERLLTAARVAAEDWDADGIYAAVGHDLKGQRGPRTLRYMGVGNPLSSRLTTAHHKLGTFSVSELWLGEPAVPGLPGRRMKRINPHLDVVEWASAYFLKIPSNEKKTKNPPDRSCVVLNRWYGTDYSSPQERPTARWADVIEWDKNRRVANLVWFGKRARVSSRNV